MLTFNTVYNYTLYNMDNFVQRFLMIEAEATSAALWMTMDNGLVVA